MVSSKQTSSTPAALKILEPPQAKSKTHQNSGFTRAFLIFGVCMIGVTITYLTAYTINRQQEERITAELNRQADDASGRLEVTLANHVNLLLAVQGLYHASNQVDRLEFRRILASIDVESRYPGARAVSWNARVRTTDTAQFQLRVQSEIQINSPDYPNFIVRPDTIYDDRFVITYIEPIKGNEGAFGFDIGSNPTRRAAVYRARDSGKAIATAPIDLVQGAASEKGFLLMLPVYRRADVKNLTERRASFAGVVVAVFSISELADLSTVSNLASMRLSDVTGLAENSVASPVYEIGVHEPGNRVITREIEIGERRWRVELGHTIQTINSHRYWNGTVIIIIGLFITVITALFIWLLSTAQGRAQKEAARLTHVLQIANKDLERSNTDLTQFAYAASHDLKSPLRAIENLADWVIEDAGDKLPEEARSNLGLLLNRVKRLSVLQDDLLQYSLLNDDQHSIELLDYAKLTKDLSDLQGREGQFRIIVSHSNDNLWTYVTPLRQVLMNLVNNAIKHHDRSAGRIVVNMSSSHTGLRISVSDDGPGIEPIYHKKIFQLFKTLKSRDVVEGSGLGLSLVNKLVYRYGGTVTIESNPAIQRGTTFIFDWPLFAEETLYTRAA